MQRHNANADAGDCLLILHYASLYWTLALRRFVKIALSTEAISQDCTRRVYWTLALRRLVKIALGEFIGR
eukprot:scaffold14324_cov129-Skeletonema_marinoi.AAC.1